MNALFVVGTFDDSGGRPSSYGKEFVRQCLVHYDFANSAVYNGGKFEDLERIVFTDFNIIFWFANVPNDKPKLVKEIKKNNPTCMLVTSKRNDDEKYDLLHLVGGALQTKSNLLVEFRKDNGRILASVFDPLGNCFLKSSGFTSVLADILMGRLNVLRGFRRQASLQIGEAIPFPEADWREQFFELVQRHAQTFHDLITAQTERFLGNVSFRCAKGFPSFRTQEKIFVSKRNIDKRNIDQDGFVAVEKAEGYVGYYGNDKPSVDTPIQLLLYQAFPHINFMLHSHTYVTNAIRTSRVIPCGALQEADEIRALVPKDCNWFRVNLHGHGSLCAAESLQMLSDIPYVARPLPEYQE